MRPIRERPSWQVKDLLRRAGSSQWEIANQCGVSQSFVSHTIHKRGGGDAEKKNRIWSAIERATARLMAEPPS